MSHTGQVAVHVQNHFEYCQDAPFHPAAAFPEYRFADALSAHNPAYAAVRGCLELLGLDRERLGTPDWNPLAEVVRPGDTVLLKPNMIAHKPGTGDHWESLITHGSVIRAAVDYVYLALGGRGRIVIADAPQEDSDIERILARIGVEAIQQFYLERTGFKVEFLDLRQRHLIAKDGVYVDSEALPGDPAGNARVNLGRHSYLAEHDGRGKQYYGAYYDVEETNQHHSGGVHEYMISGSALAADVFICLPKLKTHKKVGVTLNLKNLVGINGRKNWLPHYAIGAPEENGDQFPGKSLKTTLENSVVLKAKNMLMKGNPLARMLARKLKATGYKVFGGTNEVVRSGNWHGNDTCWRMTNDLNRILLYANPDGTLRTTPKRYFSFIDGILGMEGNGPVDGDLKTAGLIAAGFNPVSVDAVGAALMGFDYRKLQMLARAFDGGPYPLSECPPEAIEVRSNRDGLAGPLENLLARPPARFRPHFGWVGHMEVGP